MFKIPGRREFHRGRDLYKQKKCEEAEQLLRQAANKQENRLGNENVHTLQSKYYLALTLYDQKKFEEAEWLLRQVADWRESHFGSDHVDTLFSKHWLGLALYNQEKHEEAEKWFRQVADRREECFGSDQLETLASKYWLGITLYIQKKYDKAEELLRQVADAEEHTLGSDHQDTLDSKYWLGCILYEQRELKEAEDLFRQVADGREKTLGSDHEETLNALQWLRKVQQKSSPLSSTDNIAQSVPGFRLARFFQEGQQSEQSYTDSDVSEISLLLKQSNPRWSKVPRTYIILRTIGQLDFLDELIDVGFSDYWFPVTEQNLPHCLRPSIRAAFFEAQRLILTKSIGLEKGSKGQHCHFNQGEALPFESKEVLGSGEFGQVDRVLSLISFKEYARKRVLRSAAFRGRRSKDMKQFIAEIQILRRLEHSHIVDFIGSYTDSKYIGLILLPIAEMDLSVYLKRANDSNLPELRTFFGCLATALEYLHGEKIRHKDIKPGNILINRGTVLFADFGLSLDFTDASGSTTIGMVNGLTPRYCAPEVAQYQPRNTASDIWSLGVVFMEIIVVLKGRTSQYMDDFFGQRGSRQTLIRTNLDVLPEFVAELEKAGDLFDNRVLSWTQPMLSVEQKFRPTASSLVASILDTNHAGESIRFCGICCLPEDEEGFSDVGDE